KNGVSKTASGYGDQLTVPVYESSQLVGKKVAEIKWPKGTLVKVIHRSSKDIIANGQTEILAGDMLVLAVDSGQRGEVYNAMIKLQEVKFDG
ncbi:TrkA C-terminal domain-containing protein, partial [Lactobacillus acetotolerans]|uniref:TrkA C-terminal domain-containing protein n=1 Tax=Lactobacillus acetotolerans TaxID=1600 RepID=UPI002480B29D